MSILPSNIEAEQALLGGCLNFPRYIPQVKKILRSSDMYREAHKHICETLFQLRDKSDLITISEYLKQKNQLEKVGGIQYLSSLMQNVSTGAGYEHWARIIKKNSEKRKLITQCHETIEACYKEFQEIEEVLSNHKVGIRNIQAEQQIDFQKNKDLVMSVFKGIETRRQSENRFVGTPTGFKNIDRHHQGLEPKTTIYLISRPSMGKTALALNIGDNIALSDKGKVLFFSLESNDKALTRRRLSSHSGVFLSRLRTGDVDDSQWSSLVSAADEISDENLIIIDRPKYKAIEDLTSLAETFGMDSSLSLIIIDHIQRMRSRKRFQNRHLELSHVSEELSSLANEMNCPILILSQLSREVENRPQHLQYPRLSDMKESGDLEQNADSVIGLWRREKTSEIARLEGLKGRDTGTWLTALRFNRFIQKFFDCDDEPFVKAERDRKDVF